MAYRQNTEPDYHIASRLRNESIRPNQFLEMGNWSFKLIKETISRASKKTPNKLNRQETEVECPEQFWSAAKMPIAKNCYLNNMTLEPWFVNNIDCSPLKVPQIVARGTKILEQGMNVHKRCFKNLSRKTIQFFVEGIVETSIERTGESRIP